MNDLDQVLPPGLKGLLGGIEILGFEIRLPGRSTQWLEIDDSLNLLYGKNGAGKSSILEALSNFSCCQGFIEGGGSGPRPSARLVFKINPLSSAASVFINSMFDRNGVSHGWPDEEYFNPDPKESPLPSFGNLRYATRYFADKSEFWSKNFDTPGIPDFGYLRPLVKEKFHLWQLSPEKETVLLSTDTEELEVEYSDLMSFFMSDIISKEVCPVDGVYSHGWPNWYEQYLRHCVAGNLVPQDITKKMGIVDQNLIWEVDLKSNAELFELNADDKSEWYFSELIELSIDQILGLNFVHLFSEKKREYEHVFEEDSEGKIVAALTSLGRLSESTLFTLTPSVFDDQKIWTLGVASDDSKLISAIQADFLDSYALAFLFSGRISKGAMNNSNYVNFDLEIPVYSLPFIVSDLRNVQAVSEQVEDFCRYKEPHLFFDHIIDFEEKKSLLNTLCFIASQFLKSLEINIDEIKVEASDNLSDWMAGKGLQISVFDRQIDKWISPSTLSDSQTRWVDYSFAFARLNFHTSPLLILMDEPDRGLHVTASKSALESLTSVGGSMVVSTHSISALRMNSGRINHVQRNASGETYIEKLTATDGQLLSSLKLGVDPLDLLSLKRVAIFVEGFHDELVLGCLFPDKHHPVHDRMMVIATRGEKQLTNGVDSQLILSFSKMNLIIVADNIRSTFFEDKRLELLDQLRSGSTIPEIRKQLKTWNSKVLSSTKIGRINEERTMVDVFDRALVSDSLHRVQIQGIVHNDILETIDSAYFGLKKDWAALHDLHEEQKRMAIRISKETGKSINKTGDFKTWVSQNYGVRFNERVIREAFTTAFAIEVPHDLLRLKSLILEASDLA
jgi:energy-coupling factor transporter ATP-binding protein EcfA2